MTPSLEHRRLLSTRNTSDSSRGFEAHANDHLKIMYNHHLSTTEVFEKQDTAMCNEKSTIGPDSPVVDLERPIMLGIIGRSCMLVI